MTSQMPKKRRWILIIAFIGIMFCLGFVGSIYHFGYIYVSNPQPSVESSTPGTKMIVTERWRGIENGKNVVYYTARTSGVFPQNSFTQIYYPLGKGATEAGEVKIDASGQVINLESNQPIRLQLHDFALGESVLYGLISSDKKIQVFAKIVPFPIESYGDTGCKVSVELADDSGKSFSIQGEGFIAQETLNYTSNSEGEILSAKIDVQDNGKFQILFLPAVIGKLSGKDEIRFIGQQCETTVEYEWGPPAIQNKQ